MTILRVALSVPLYRLFDYIWQGTAQAHVGMCVRVPFGPRECIGVVMALANESECPESQLKCALEAGNDLPLLPLHFLQLCEFASAYYQAPIGEAILQALPSGLKRLAQVRRRKPVQPMPLAPSPAVQQPIMNAQQLQAVQEILSVDRFCPFLLHGVTGSGKTEVYLRIISAVLEAGGQILLLVPEINLTPQLESRVCARFPGRKVISLHSELNEAARERNWRAAFSGEADIVLGTRLAVFTPMPRLQLIVVDEEHDASFKQQEGMRYSARDVAVFRASMLSIPIILGSATPALETWANAESGRYRRLQLRERAHHAARLPIVRLIDTRQRKLQEGFSEELAEAIATRLERGEQSLVFLNRRGYAPVLACPACGWVSHCRRCAAHLVLHLADRRLRCHHCGFEARIPGGCPTCGNQDIHPFGRGTQRLEAWLRERFPQARIVRVDRDAVRSRKQWDAVLQGIHAGEAEILVGTQMLAKGHDFPGLTLVCVLGADSALFAADWRAPERLFAQLMQVSGRAGRADRPGEVLVQTQYPEHPLFQALVAHDYEGFATAQLNERRQAGFPPYAYQAILRAEAPEMKKALAFLGVARVMPELDDYPGVSLFDPVPMRLARLANLERAQLLVESSSRSVLQSFLPHWRQFIETIKAPARLRWHIEVDPLEL